MFYTGVILTVSIDISVDVEDVDVFPNVHDSFNKRKENCLVS